MLSFVPCAWIVHAATPMQRMLMIPSACHAMPTHPHPTSAHTVGCCSSCSPSQDISHSRYVVRPEAESYATAGSPEAQVFAAVPAEGITLAALKDLLPGDVADLGFRQAMQQK